MEWPDIWFPPINLYNVPEQENLMTIVKATVTKGKPYPRNAEIIAFFEDKGLYESTTWKDQLEKLEEEVDELKDALLLGADEEVLLEAGDVYVCLLNILKTCGLEMGTSVDKVTEKLIRRKGSVINGQFVKEE